VSDIPALHSGWLLLLKIEISSIVHCCFSKQQWTIEEISIFSNSSHFEWKGGMSDTILKGTHPRTIPAKFSVIWFSGFREDLNVTFYQNMPNLHNWYKSPERKVHCCFSINQNELKF
jgi:hypothetical protein